MKALGGVFKQEKALVGAFSVIVKLRVTFATVRLKLYFQHSSIVLISIHQQRHQHHLTRRQQGNTSPALGVTSDPSLRHNAVQCYPCNMQSRLPWQSYTLMYYARHEVTFAASRDNFVVH